MTSLKDDSSYPTREETEENNFIEQEAPRTPQKPWSRPSKSEPPSLPAPAPTKPPTEDLQKNEVVNTQQMCKLPFSCLFWIQLHLKMGGAGSGFRDGRCRVVKIIGQYIVLTKKEKKKTKLLFKIGLKPKKIGNNCPFTIERAIMDNKGKKK